MSTFNLKTFMLQKMAAKDSVVTEKQLRGGKDSKESDATSEKQLDCHRKDEKSQPLTEKKLDGVRQASVITEKQLRDGKDSKEVTEVPEGQLESSRKDDTKNPGTEKQLDKVRCAACEDISIRSEAKSKDVVITEKDLRGGKDQKDPNEISEKQLESERKGEEPKPIEKKLDGVRAGAIEVLVEGALDKSKSKLVQHRNPETSAGNVPKLEEKRLAGKPAEKEKYEAASSYDKKLSFPIVKGKDGLQTAWALTDFDIVWKKTAAGRYTDVFEETDPVEADPFDFGVEGKGVGGSRFLSEESLSPVEEREIARATTGLEVDDEEFQPTEEDERSLKSELDPDKDPLTLYRTIEVESGQPETSDKMYQYTFIFEPFDFRTENKARKEAVAWLSGYFGMPRSEIDQRLSLNYEKGIATINVEK